MTAHGIENLIPYFNEEEKSEEPPMQKSAATDIKTNPEEEAAGYSRVLMRVSPSEGEAPVEIMIEAQYQQALSQIM